MAAGAAGGQQYYASFRDNRVFPVFNKLPSENDVMTGCKKHWAFLSEIVEVEQITRLVLNVQDKTGNLVRVAFYTNGRGREVDQRLVKPGNTVLNMYGVQHEFLDGTWGIREEDISSVKIIPMSLDGLLRLSDRVIRYSTDYSNGTRICHGCDAKKESLQKCAKCGMFWYCNKDCQTIGWTENGHKQDCRVIVDKDVQGLLTTDWMHFDEAIKLPLR